MILNDLNRLGLEVREKIKNYDNKELILSDSFKNEFSNFLLSNSKDKIEYQKFTSVVTTPKDLKIIFPNQWFYIASFFYDFLNSLWKYKEIINELNFSDEIIKNLRNSSTNEEIDILLKSKLDNEVDLNYFKLFLTNYEWWFGSKTIDRGDFFVSSVLNLSKVVNVSHSYLADLAYYLSKDKNLKDLISKDYNNFSVENSVSNEIILLENKNLRAILKSSFDYLIDNYGENKVLFGYEIKDAKIENREYKGLSLPEYFGFEILIGIFDNIQNGESLKSSGTLRFINEELTILNKPNCYFTSQWNESNNRGLTLGNFNNFLSKISDGTLKIIKDEKEFKLIKLTKITSTSPLKKLEQIIYYGAPGTGKSHKVDQEIQNLDSLFYERVTFHPEYDHSSFIGGYKPKTDQKGEIKYEFVPQVFINIYERAWNDEKNHYYLIIEEINRGNCAEIFGDIFQLLDRTSNYNVSPSTELRLYLENVLTNKKGIINGLKLPSNLTIYATMNTSDQSLFPMDSAFKRRWDWEYIPIIYKNEKNKDDDNLSFKFIVEIDEETSFEWIEFIEKINLNHIMDNESLGMDKCLGNYFIKPDLVDNHISLKSFINKVIFYLWNDVFKDEDSIIFKGLAYEKFFPIDDKGKEAVIKILNTLDVTINKKQ